MFELIVLLIFFWLFWSAIRLTFHITWSLAKVAAVALFVLALSSLIACLLFASGVILLLPVALVAGAWGILKLYA